MEFLPHVDIRASTDRRWGLLLCAVFLYLSPVFAQAADFITTWKTDNPGTSGANEITIPTAGGGYNYSIDWGDGNTDVGVTGSITHTYAVPGTYTVKISGTFPRIYFANTGDKEKILSIEQWGDGAWSNMFYAFFGTTNLVINATDVPDVSNVTDMHSMFRNSGIGSPDFSGWDTSNVTRMAYMFLDAVNFNGDITTWDTSSVTNMIGMFLRAPVFNQAIGGWDVSSVTNMQQMFQQATAFNQDLGPWGNKTGSVTTMLNMFYLATSFNQNIDSWDVSSVTTMRNMFLRASSFNQDLNSWDVSNVVSMWAMFQQASAFNGDISNWDTGSVTDMQAMFYLASAFNQDISDWDTADVTTMRFMFARATAFNQDITAWDTGMVTTMEYMFWLAVNFNQEIGGWDTAMVQNMGIMFQQAAAFNGDISAWDTGSVTDMRQMFYLATVFDQDIGAWDTADVINMRYMFARATAFNQDIGAWDTGMVTNMERMFWLASSFNQEIGGWDTAMVQNMRLMFQDARLFNGDISGWDTGNATTMQQMFYRALAFDQDLGGWDVTSLTIASNMFTLATLSTQNYDSLLIGWDAQGLNPNVNFHGGFSKYCQGEAARANMIASDGWTIADAGLGCPNAAPTDIAIDGANTDAVDENSPVGTNIGALTTVDDDAGDTHTYTLGCDTAGPDDALFQISGTNLQTNAIFDVENPSDANADGTYEVCILTTDDGDPAESYEEIITITINNEEPDIKIIKGVSDNEPQVGSTVTFTLTVSNGGPDDATTIVVNDLVPAGFTYAGTITGGSSQDDSNPNSGSGLEWVINSLAASAPAISLSFTATVNPP